MNLGRIWMVYTGNKTAENNKLTMCTISKRKVEKFITSKIKKGVFEYLLHDDGLPCGSYGTDDAGRAKQVESFKNDFAEERYGLISLCLQGGYIDHLRDGKEYS